MDRVSLSESIYSCKPLASKFSFISGLPYKFWKTEEFTTGNPLSSISNGSFSGLIENDSLRKLCHCSNQTSLYRHPQFHTSSSTSKVSSEEADIGPMPIQIQMHQASNIRSKCIASVCSLQNLHLLSGLENPTLVLFFALRCRRGLPSTTFTPCLNCKPLLLTTIVFVLCNGGLMKRFYISRRNVFPHSPLSFTCGLK